MTREEKKKDVIKFLSEAAEEMMEKIGTEEVPQSGKFRGQAISFYLTGTDNWGSIIYKCDPIDPSSQRRLSLAVRRNGSSYYIESPLIKGTNEEAKAFLDFTEAQLDEYSDRILELSDDADDRDDRFMK